MDGENGEPNADPPPTDTIPGGAKRKDGSDRSPRVSSDEVARRIDLIAKRMASGASDRQIAREFCEQWGLSKASTLRHYVSHAREVFRKRAGLSRIQAKGRSLEFWAGRMAKYLAQEKALEERMETLEQRESDTSQRLAECDEDSRECLTQELAIIQKAISRNQSALNAIASQIHSMGDRADRIYGTLAPLKIAETNSHGDDRPRTQAEILTELTRLGMVIPDMPLPPGLEHSHAIPADFERIDLPSVTQP